MTPLPVMPHEPEYRDKWWWYKGSKYYQSEAFRKYGDDRAQVLQAWLAEAMKYIEHTKDCELNIGYDRGWPCDCGLDALREHLRNGGLAK